MGKEELQERYEILCEFEAMFERLLNEHNLAKRNQMIAELKDKIYYFKKALELQMAVEKDNQ